MNWHCRAAMWLLKRSGAAEENRPLIGDLLEERAAGKSAAWLWRQTFALLARRIVRDLRQHKCLAIRAVLTGMLALFAGMLARQHITPSVSWSNGRVEFWFITFSMLLLAGRLVGITHRKHNLAMLAAFGLYVVFARAWVYTTHFDHYWSWSNPLQFLIDMSLTGLGILLIFVGGLLPARAAVEATETPEASRLEERP